MFINKVIIPKSVLEKLKEISGFDLKIDYDLIVEYIKNKRCKLIGDKEFTVDTGFDRRYLATRGKAEVCDWLAYRYFTKRYGRW